MKEAIRYYLRKLDDANDLTGIGHVHKLIQLEHQPTIDNTLEGLKNVQYPRHFPNHLVVQLARLNRPSINESLISYFKMHFKATNTEWHAISALQDDRVVATVENAIHEYEKTYFSRKVVTRCIHLLARIGSQSAFKALKALIDDYLITEHRFIDNYDVPLASIALEALTRIKLPEAKNYLQEASKQYQDRIEAELTSYPARLSKERTAIGIDLHEGSALNRMKQFAIPTLIDWHRNHPSKQVHDFALTHIISTLESQANQSDALLQSGVHYLLSLYDELFTSNKQGIVLKILNAQVDSAVIPFAWRIFEEGVAREEALNVLAHQKAEAVLEDVLAHFYAFDEKSLRSRDNLREIKAYIHYFGHINHSQARQTLMTLYQRRIRHFQISIAEALATQAQYDESALDFINHIVENDDDLYTVKQTITLLPSIGDSALLILLSLLDCEDERQYYAIEALGLLRNIQAIPYLMETLLASDGNKKLEEHTIKALERIGTEASFAALNAWEQEN